MDFSEHVVISAAGAAAAGLGTGDPTAAAAFAAAGIFIDLDHLADYFRETGFNTDLGRFMNYFSTRSPRRLLLFLHGWEWCALLFAAALAGLGPPWLPWLALGWLSHMLLDQRFNRLHPLAYFFFYRLRHGFKAERLYT